MMIERHLSVDPSTIWRWVQRYAPELNARTRRKLKRTNGSWRTDETYLRVAERWTYLYRAVDSSGATIDFFLSETRDVFAARTFFHKALAAPGHPRPRVINVDGKPSYTVMMSEVLDTKALGFGQP
jgi:transposase-like protein